MTSPMLVDATDLEMWANRLGAQSSLPEVVRRLILATTPSLSKIVFPAGEGVQQRGWDGIVVAERGTPFVPEKTSVWELGTGRDVRRKADDDYARRSKSPEGIIPSEATYVFVTPRRWAAKEAWARERSADGVWKEVRAYTADELEAWLASAPAVHTWLSELLGKRSEDSVDLDTFWQDWTQQTNPPLTPELLLLGRREIAAELVNRLKDSAAPVVLRGESREEALAVLAATVVELPDDERSAFSSRVLIARSEAAWRRHATADSPLILIPFFEEANELVRALKGGHAVFVPLGRADAPYGSELDLPRLRRDAVERLLKEYGVPQDAAREAARVARRSLMTLRRRLAVAPILKQPQWAGPANARQLLPALLAGAWDDSSEGDRAAIGQLARAPYEEYAETLVRWAHEPDAPIQRTHRTWAVISKQDMWSLLSRYLLRDDLDRFVSAALEVLGVDDPIYDLPADERWMGRVHGHVLKHSDVLRTGIADSIAMLGAAPQEHLTAATPAAAVAGRLVSQLLIRASSDWRLWASLSHLLPLLAEAAPDEFMAGVERGLVGEQAPLAKLFIDSDSPFGSSPHTGLLWALETLAWDPRYVGNAALLLARLATIDPGGRLANRPAASLKGIFLPWHPQTAASLEQRLRVIDSLRLRAPSVAWDLMKAMMPDSSVAAFGHASPHWREWKPDPEPRVTNGEWLTGVREIAVRMLKDAGTEGARWRDLISLIPSLSEDLEAAILAETTVPGRFDESSRALLADELRKIVSRHRSFSDTEWALAKDRVDRLLAAYERIRPDDSVTRHAWLFARDPALLEGGERDLEARQQRIETAREGAVRDIVNAHGASGIVRLVEHSEAPEQVGFTVGKAELLVDDERSLLRENLASIDDQRRQFARGFVAGRVERSGLDWIRKALADEELSSEQRSDALRTLRPRREVWAIARQHGPDVEGRYWASMQCWGVHDDDVEEGVRELLAHDRPYSAVELLGIHVERRQADIKTIIEALNAPLHAEAPADKPSHSFSYYVAQLLDVADSHPDADLGKLALLEWGYISALRHTREPRRLFDELSRNPKFFVDLVGFLYRGEGEEPREVSELEKARAQRAFQVLDSWRAVPGASAGRVDKAALAKWIADAREELGRRGRGEIGEHIIGQVLSGSPVDADGAWPNSAVRDVIEDVGSESLERGVEIGVRNGRGVVSKSLDEGGAQERALAERYEGYAAAVKDMWPRTAATLRRLAASYRAEAQFEDERAETDQGLFQVSSAKAPKVKATPPVRAVQSWIWDVFTPQLDHLEYEKRVLGRTLSFRSNTRGFERLAPLRDALTADGQHVFDDMRGDVPEYDGIVDEHDSRLDALIGRARELFDSLVASARFRAIVQDVIQELRAQGTDSLPAPGDEHLWDGYLAADVVNDVGADLSREYSEWRVWNSGAIRLKAEAPRALQAALDGQRTQFLTVVGGCADRLFRLRKRLSREYDIPVTRPVAEG